MVWQNTLKKIMSDNGASIITFLGVGLLTAIVYLSLVHFLTETCQFNYHIGVTIGYVISIVIYFFANRTFTFKNNDDKIGHQFIRFLMMVSVNYIITLMIVHYSVEYLQLKAYIATIISIIATTIFNYIIAKSWVFSRSTAK